tara:strand:- start:2268 stop:2744 length:477 start_codon:yes stop_codon:yes gene_type:complete
LDIGKESHFSTDTFFHAIIIKQIELLLNYSNRFYHRQFLTRKQAGNSLFSNFESLLNLYFEESEAIFKIPNVGYFAERMNISRNYHSDMPRSTTGKSTQQHIPQKLIEKAKVLLSTLERNVSEITYNLGFEYLQSFHKFCKSKMNLSSLEFRASFSYI